MPLYSVVTSALRLRPMPSRPAFSYRPSAAVAPSPDECFCRGKVSVAAEVSRGALSEVALLVGDLEMASA